MRVVLDTNVLISAFASPSGTPGKIYKAWIAGQFELIISSYILAEFQRIAVIKLGFRQARVVPILKLFGQLANVVEPQDFHIHGIEDNDQLIAGTAISGRANFLVTGDKKLLWVKELIGIIVINPNDFFALLANTN